MVYCMARRPTCSPSASAPTSKRADPRPLRVVSFISPLRRIALVGLAFASLATFAATGEPTRFEERQRYLDALAALNGGNLADFERLKKSLVEYPLYPYLE